ncbi:MAG: dihydropteroate synthase [Deltaproteobacteria bacterium]|nr:dihydropteroate synthase [Candidatus Anaeroferrophillacea bacterium]
MMRTFHVHRLDLADADDAATAMERIGSDRHGIGLMKRKMVHTTLRVGPLPARAANIIKQEMLAVGGEAAVSRGVIDCSAPDGPVLLSATHKQYGRFLRKLKPQPFSLARLGEQIRAVLDHYDGREPQPFTCRGLDVDLRQRTLIMGTLNVTPDSFSDGNRFFTADRALEHARRMIDEGADIIDIGGESTRPGSRAVDADEEIGRVEPVIADLRREWPDIPISIDTCKSGVAGAAVTAGADMINDISGGRIDPAILAVAAQTGARLCLMHMQSTPETMQREPHYDDVVAEILAELQEMVNRAVAAGVARERIIIDPGIGFGKTLEHNLTIMRCLGEFHSLGLPVLLGTSRKSFIGRITGREVDDRLAGTLATLAHAVAKGVQIVRVHDVAAARDAVRMMEAIRGAAR